MIAVIVDEPADREPELGPITEADIDAARRELARWPSAPDVQLPTCCKRDCGCQCDNRLGNCGCWDFDGADDGSLDCE